MKTILYASSIVMTMALLAGAPARARELAGVTLAEQTVHGGDTLLLNGAGLRTRLMFKVYVAALYLPARERDAALILKSRWPVQVRLHMLREVDADSLLTALNDGLRDNLDPAALDALAAPRAELARIFREIGQARDKDQIQLDIDNQGLAVALNGKPRGLVGSEALGRALLRVWLGERPVDAALKSAMLGQ